MALDNRPLYYNTWDIGNGRDHDDLLGRSLPVGVGNTGGNTVLPSSVPAGPVNADRTRELELRVAQLEAHVATERRERAGLDGEVQRLREENQRLQEESQTAAAQLRKFTEWFFNTMENRQ